MENDLFRSDVLSARNFQAFGQVTVSTPVTQVVWESSGLLSTCVVASWLVFGHYTRIERVIHHSPIAVRIEPIVKPLIEVMRGTNAYKPSADP